MIFGHKNRQKMKVSGPRNHQNGTISGPRNRQYDQENLYVHDGCTPRGMKLRNSVWTTK